MRPPRYTLAAFCFACMALSYMDRWNLSVAAPLLMEEFGWSETTIGLLQSLFFYGFTASHLPGGWLADRLGGRRVLGTGVLAWSLATGITPLAASFGAFGAVRLTLGLGEGVNMPSILNLVGRWFPVEERTRATAVVVTGVQTGTLIAMPLSAWIAASLGWRAVFYTYAVIGLGWVALWFAWATERPPGRLEPGRASTSAAPLPWGVLVRQRAVWALVLTTFVTNWTVWFFHSWLPTYFMRVHGFSLKESGLASALPNLAMIVAGLASGAIADGLIARGVGVTRVRKGLLAAGFSGAIVLLLLLPHAHTRIRALLCLSAALGCFALGATTVLVNSLDLAPAHAGVMVGLQGTVGNVAGMISPVLGGAIVARTGRWDLNFYVIAALLAAGVVLWTRWARAEPLTPPPRP